MEERDIQRVIERHDVMISQLDRRIATMESTQAELLESFGLLNQSIGELKAEIRARFDYDRRLATESNGAQKAQVAMIWAILALILGQLVSLAFEFLKR